MPAVSTEISPEVLQVPLMERVDIPIGYIPETERTGFVSPILSNRERYPGEVRARRNLVVEDSSLLNLDVSLELGLKGKNEDVGAPRREDFKSKKEYADAYRRYLIQNTNVGESVANSAWRGIVNPGWWKRRPGGEA